MRFVRASIDGIPVPVRPDKDEPDVYDLVTGGRTYSELGLVVGFDKPVYAIFKCNGKSVITVGENVRKSGLFDSCEIIEVSGQPLIEVDVFEIDGVQVDNATYVNGVTIKFV